MVIYVAIDVFKIVYHYNTYYTDNDIVGINRAYASTMTYINQNSQFHYNSFIFGNSRSLYYQVDTWKKYLPENSRCMHYDEFGGSISGIRDKMAFIDKNGGHIDHALLVIDYRLLSFYDREQGYLYLAPPILKNNSNLIKFHVQHFSAFLNPMFIFALVDYNLYKTYRPYMEGLIKIRHSIYIPQYNEFQNTVEEAEIREGIYYNPTRLEVFKNKQKPGSFSSEVLGSKEIECLKETKRLFDKHKTSYKIIISPLYDQIKLNRRTYMTLCKIFGKERIFDFSGVNKWNKDYHNYYEYSHYRPVVAEEIMDIIYSWKD